MAASKLSMPYEGQRGPNAVNSNNMPHEFVPRHPTGSFHDQPHHDSEPSPSPRPLIAATPSALQVYGAWSPGLKTTLAEYRPCLTLPGESSRMKAAEAGLVVAE